MSTSETSSLPSEGFESFRSDDLKKGIHEGNKKIQELAQEVNDKNEAIVSKNEEIEALKLRVKKLETENVVLEKKNCLLEEEVKNLKKRIKKLEAEKEDLEKQLADLNQKFGKLEGDNLVLDEDMNRLKTQIEDLKKENKDLKEDNKDLKGDVGDLKKENKDLKGDVGVLKSEIEQLRSDNKGPLLLLGEMCFQIPSLMYKMVIPGWHVKSSTYNVQDIEDHIKELGHEESEESKILAQKKWDELKKELNWEAKYSKHLKTVKSTRNTAAHPAIDEESLHKAARDAKENGMLTNYIYDNIVELIGIWEKLDKKQ